MAAADAAARVHRRWSGRLDTRGADSKAPGDFVSRADLEAQEAALRVIRGRHPDHDVLAEEDEEGDVAVTEGGGERPLWIVDPLDGTANFLHGHPAYASSVAVAIGGSTVAGVVACAPTGERWWAARGRGAWKNGRPVRVSGTEELQGSLIGTGFPFKALDRMDAYGAQLAAFLRAGAGVRRGGAAALDLCYLAEGRFDGFWELFLNPWDFAAGIVVIEEAGGVVCAPDGGRLALAPGGVLAANGRPMLERILEVVAG